MITESIESTEINRMSRIVQFHRPFLESEIFLDSILNVIPSSERSMSRVRQEITSGERFFFFFFFFFLSGRNRERGTSIQREIITESGTMSVTISSCFGIVVARFDDSLIRGVIKKTSIPIPGNLPPIPPASITTSFSLRFVFPRCNRAILIVPRVRSLLIARSLARD